mgnify:CR=1 FL=1
MREAGSHKPGFYGREMAGAHNLSENITQFFRR